MWPSDHFSAQPSAHPVITPARLMSPSAPCSQKTWDPTLMVNRHLIPAAEKHSCILTLPFTMQLILGDDNFIFCWLGKYKIAKCCWDHQSVCSKIFILSAIKVSTSTTHNTQVQAPDICPVIDLQILPSRWQQSVLAAAVCRVISAKSVLCGNKN